MKIYQLSVICIALLGGCAPRVAEWTPAESPKENIVDRAIFTHLIHYPAHQNEMPTKEKESLRKFLKGTVLRASAVTVILEEYGGQSEKRIRDIKRELLKFGIPQELITVEEGCRPRGYKHHQRGQHSGVEVIVERYVVIPPSCADFSQPIGNSLQEFPHSNFGCADAVNFGMMVANPRDLIRGRPLGDSDGTVIAAGVARYRTDKVKELIDTSTTVEPGATTSSSSQSATGASAGASY